MGKRSKQENKYIHNLARNIMGENGILLGQFDTTSPHLAANIWKSYGRQIWFSLAITMTPETLGKICACGLGATTDGQFTMSQAHFTSNWLQAFKADGEGKSLLAYIAATVIVAAIADNLRYGDIFERRGSLSMPRLPDGEAFHSSGQMKPSRPTLEDYDRR